jgi:hypothetical protein
LPKAPPEPFQRKNNPSSFKEWNEFKATLNGILKEPNAQKKQNHGIPSFPPFFPREEKKEGFQGFLWLVFAGW